MCCFIWKCLRIWVHKLLYYAFFIDEDFDVKLIGCTEKHRNPQCPITTEICSVFLICPYTESKFVSSLVSFHVVLTEKFYSQKFYIWHDFHFCENIKHTKVKPDCTYFKRKKLINDKDKLFSSLWNNCLYCKNVLTIP